MNCPAKPDRLADLDCRHAAICEWECPLKATVQPPTGRICPASEPIDRAFIQTVIESLDVRADK